MSILSCERAEHGSLAYTVLTEPAGVGGDVGLPGLLLHRCTHSDSSANIHLVRTNALG